MESAIKELISEFNEYWEKQDVTHNSQADFLNMIMRAYEIGKSVIRSLVEKTDREAKK